MKTMLTVECEHCGGPFQRELGQVNRNRRKGMGLYCSLSHAKLANPSLNEETKRLMADRLWRKVTFGDGCWEFTGAKNGYGYGVLIQTIDGQRHERLAHRVAWESMFGPIPAGLNACHHCDNPPCVKPSHLFLGTHAENMLDMVSKGRAGWQRSKLPTTSADQSLLEQ